MTVALGSISKIFSLLAVVTTLLSCCCSPASSFAFLPRVSRTKDAIIIDFAGVGYAPSYHGKTLYGQIVNPEFIQLPSVYPHPMAYRQQQQTPNGWSYSFEYPSPIALEDVPSARQRGAATATTTTRRTTTTTKTTTRPTTTRTTTRPTTTTRTTTTTRPTTTTRTTTTTRPTTTTTKTTTTTPTTTPTTMPTTTPTTTPAAPVIQCGKGPTALPARSLIVGRIDGGTTAKSNAWPFLVSLKKSSDPAGVYFCGGTLISDSKVLLAASCLEKMSLYEMSGVTVLIGVTSSTDVQMTRRISKVALHSKFNAATYANDIAIITLDAPVVLSRTVGTICLPPANGDPDQDVDQSAVIVGWATADSSASTALKQGTVLISSNFDCKADENFGKYVTDANICISATDKFVCPGDIGGPVLVLSSPGTWTQIGINSYASGDCESNSLQTRVSAFRAWIDLYKN